MTDLADAVSRAVFEHAGVARDADAVGDGSGGGAGIGASSGAGGSDSGDPGQQLTAEESLALIGASAAAEQQAAAMLNGAVVAARAANVSWARIGGELGMTRQAAQQRFGVPTDHEPLADESATERWLGPVTAFDEMKELELAGRAGWHTVEAGPFTHRMVRTATQWQHRRVLWRGSLARDEAAGWQVACRAFPWIYLVRDTGVAAEDTETP